MGPRRMTTQVVVCLIPSEVLKYQIVIFKGKKHIHRVSFSKDSSVLKAKCLTKTITA